MLSCVALVKTSIISTSTDLAKKVDSIPDHSIIKNLSLGADKIEKIRQIWREWLDQISDPENLAPLMHQMELVRRSKIGNQDFIRIHTDHIARLLDARGRAMKVRCVTSRCCLWQCRTPFFGCQRGFESRCFGEVGRFWL